VALEDTMLGATANADMLSRRDFYIWQ